MTVVSVAARQHLLIGTARLSNSNATVNDAGNYESLSRDDHSGWNDDEE